MASASACGMMSCLPSMRAWAIEAWMSNGYSAASYETEAL